MSNDHIESGQDRRVQEDRLDTVLREAENSGVSDRTLLDIMADVKRRLRADGRV